MSTTPQVGQPQFQHYSSDFTEDPLFILYSLFIEYVHLVLLSIKLSKTSARTWPLYLAIFSGLHTSGFTPHQARLALLPARLLGSSRGRFFYSSLCCHFCLIVSHIPLDLCFQASYQLVASQLGRTVQGPNPHRTVPNPRIL